ncbi:type VI secretion system contractile sheath small subunit [Microbulbifer sp. S227A]|uniref:type VI secretion system contractile sheath small subunit n=1 Tax=Microbulbifer sp. S227A TaxID=3415131 RepID=UPI003C7A47B6
MSESSQKFISRNRAPRVQIEYDIELYGSQKKVQLPFVMGVMSDLTGKSTAPQPSIDDRKFLEIDVDNFDERMRGMQPRAAFSVPNTLTGEGNLAVDLTFERMEDFSPQAIAAKIAPLRELLEARTQLSTLLAYMDGKTGAETLIEKILGNPALLSALAGAQQDEADQAAVLDGLRDMATPAPVPADRADSVLEGLKAQSPLQDPQPDSSAEVLAALAQSAPDPSAPDTGGADVLARLRDQSPSDTVQEDGAQAALDALRAKAPAEQAADRSVDDTLAGLANAEPDDDPVPDTTAAALDSLAQAAPPDDPAGDDVADTLAGLAAASPDDAITQDDVGAALDSLASAAMAAPDEEDRTEDTLADLAGLSPGDDSQPDSVGAALDSLANAEIAAPDEDGADDTLAGLAAAAPQDVAGADETAAALDSLARNPAEAVTEEDVAGDTLADLAAAAPVDTPEEDRVDAVLGELPEVETPQQDTSDDTLAALAAAPQDQAPASDEVAAALGSLAELDSQAPQDTAADAALAGLADQAPPDPSPTDDIASALDGLAGHDAPPDGDRTEDVLAELGDALPQDAGQEDVLGDVLDDLVADGADTVSGDGAAEQPADGAGGLDDLLGLSDASDEPADDRQPEPDALDDLLGDLGEVDPDEAGDGETAPAAPDTALDAGLDDLLGDLEDPGPAVDELPSDETGDLDDLLGDLDAPVADDTPAAAPEQAQPVEDAETGVGDTGDLDDLLAEGDTPADDLDDLLGGLDDPEPADAPAAVEDPLEGILAESAASEIDLDDLLDESTATNAGVEAKPAGEAEFAFGVLTGDRPDAERLNRKRFRIALMGDFSGRAARGVVETGEALAARAPVPLDPDTLEEVIKSFATTLVLPIGKDGAGVELRLNELDDLHPDELYETVPILSELRALRAQLASGSTATNAAERLKAWGEAHGTPVAPPRSKSGGTAMPANLKLSEFQKLIGDTGATLTAASPVEDLIAQIVGPHVRAVADADTVAMQQAVDAALAAAMRLILHHPEFQAVEAQWRSLDLIARSIEADDTLEVILYDISAEEIGADLAAADELAQSGLVRLLTETPLDPETGRGGYSAIVGLYSFEETPPHAELLGRIARVAAHVDAPFLAALSPGFMETAKEDRHPLVATAWDGLRAMPEAGHLGLAAPRFLLRRPYGAKSEPVYAFEFEEFTMAEGLRGMLWANPVVLVAILLAKSFRQNGAHMGLGSIMSLGDMPYHFVTDQYGDQVALPCTERNLTLDKVEKVMARGVMPVVSIKGRDEIRLASFQSLAGGDILGPWSDAPPPPPSPPKPNPTPVAETTDDGAPGDDDLGLDDLLAGFDDAATPDAGDGDVDADLAALLEDL